MSERAEASESAFWRDDDDAEALQRYRVLVNTIDDGIYQLDAEGRFVAVNDVIVETTGYAREELLGEHVSVLLDPEDVSALEREIERRLGKSSERNEPSDRQSETFELAVRAADGDRVRCELRMNLLVEDGAFRGTIGVVRDVTERKRTERKRTERALDEHREREQELERYEAIVEAVNDGVYVVDGDGRFTMVNEAYAELTGYSREELLGEHVSLVDESVRRAEQTEATFALLPGSDEERRVGVVRDVSERKEREQALRERERQHSTLMENVPGMVYRCRNEPGWPMEFVSDACREVTGYDPDAVERGGVNWGEDVMIDEDRAEIRQAVRAAVDDRETFTVTYRIETADGDRRWVRSHGRGVFDEDGETVGIEGIISDVTERKRLEDELDEMFGRLTDAFYALDDRWRITHANERAEELIDYEGEGLVGRDFWEVFEWATDSKLGEEYRAAMETQEPTSFEFYYPEPLEAWYEIHAYPSETGLSVYFRDITDRKRFEDALAALHDSSLELFRAESTEEVARRVVEAGTEVLELSDVALYLYDDERGDLSPAAKATEEGFMWDDLPRIPPDDSTIAGQAFAAGESILWDDIRDSPNVITTETDMRSGVYVPVGDHGVAFAGSSTADAFGERTRQLLELLGANAEVALDRVERERELEESERRYRTLVDHFPNGAVALVDEDLHYRTVGGSPLDVADATTEEVEGSPVREVLPAELADEIVPRYEAALDGNSSAFEFEAGYSDRIYRFHVVPVRDADGTVFAALGMSQDITERKERERQLQRYREFTDAVLDAIDDVFYILDESGDLQRWNDSLCEVTGYGDDEVESMNALEFFGEEARAEIAGAIRECFETGSVQVETEVLTKAGDRIPFEFAASVLEDPEGDRVLAGIGRDVTEQRRREQDLRDAKSQLEAATEAGAVGTWEWHIPEDEFVTDTSFARTFGVDPDAAREGVSLDRFVSAIHDDDRERVERKIEEAVETGGEYEAEYRVWNADDELRWVVARGHVECDEGTPVTFPGALADITERKRAETELEEHRKQLETLFEVLPIGVVVAEEDGTLVEANETAKELWGGDVFDAESIADYDRYRGWWADTGEPVDPDEWTMSRVLRGEEIAEPDIYEIEALDGERRTIMVHGMPVQKSNGEVTRGVVTLTDVTERRVYQRQLEESERRYRTLAEHFPNGAVGVYDRDLRYTLAQGAVLGDKLAGRDSLEGRRVSEIFPSDTVEDLEPVFRTAVEDGETDSTTTEFVGRNWRVWATPLRDANGEIFAGLSFTQDITEQVERERKLEETVAKLEESNERLESFASMLAHELRNPVTIGQIYSQQLPTEPVSDESVSDAVGYVTEAFDRMEDIIDVMLVLTRGEEAVGERNPLPISEVARDAWDSVDTPDATLAVEIDDVMRADETYVRHLFRNLFENAVEHGSTNNRPSADDAVQRGGPDVAVRVGELPDGFYVSDDGPGIPAEERDAVFEAGFTTAGDQGGTGLGLAFVEKLADVYEWQCDVTESAAGGARFEFRNVDLDAAE